MIEPPLPSPFRWEREHMVADLDGGRALFTSRRGGVSTGPYASLNLGRLTDDDGAHVDANRDRLAALVGLARDRFAYGRQVHGTAVRAVTEPPSAARPATEEDGQATALTDLAALVFVADCLPILLVAPGGVAALHGGWRGLAGGIVEVGVGALRELAGDGPIVAALGPSARGCCYEVDDELRTRFGAYDALRGPNLALDAVARAQLAAAGVDQVHDCGLCTICSDPGLFFSHRRDGGVTGRQAGVAWRA